MNELSTNQSPVVINSPIEAAKAFSVANLIFHPFAMERLDQFAANMAKAKGLLPLSISGDPEMCKALIIEAGSRNMSPYAIGRHAFKQPNGSLGFESKVYKAMAKASLGVEFEYNQIGDWSKVIGKFQKVKSDKGSGFYNSATYTPSDEIGLAVEVVANFPSGKIKRMTVYMSQCHPRISANWANDPYTQTIYAATKKFLRIEEPEVIMGIFDEDDFLRDNKEEREINPIAGASIDKENISVDDVFSESQQQFERPQEPIVEPDIDDNFNARSKKDELSDLINSATSLDELFEYGTFVSESLVSGEISDIESKELRAIYQAVKNAL